MNSSSTNTAPGWDVETAQAARRHVAGYLEAPPAIVSWWLTGAIGEIDRLRTELAWAEHDLSIAAQVARERLPETRSVEIPACDEHGGIASRRVVLPWVCPRCGGPRGEPFPGISFDGSLRLACDRWLNPCGHVDTYEQVRAEADQTTAGEVPDAQ